MAAPDYALQHAADRVALVEGAAAVAAQQWGKVDRDRIPESWLSLLPRLLLALITGQRLAAAAAEPYAGAAAASAGLSTLTAGALQAAAFAGTAADGRSLLTLMLQPVITALTAIGNGVDVSSAMNAGGAQLDNIVRTEVADAGRTADQVAMIATPSIDGYIRVVVGDTCNRCLILAGRWYRYSQWFERHPQCDCIHLPAPEAEAAGLVQDPRAIYEGLTRTERTEAGWTAVEQEAIDEGGDIIALTNYRRGVYTAGGRQYTREGTTRAGLYGGYDIDPDTGKLTRRPKGSKRKAPRLTPEQIFEDADGDRDEAIRLLRVNGYLTGDASPSAKVQAPAVPDLETAARDRQSKIDAVRAKANNLAELGEMLLNEADASDVRRRMTAMELADDPQLAELLDADLDDPEAFRADLDEVAEQLGLQRIGGDIIVVVRNRLGLFEIERTRFDRKLHEAVGGQLRDGMQVDLVRPGYSGDVDGEKVQLFKAKVEESGDEEIITQRPVRPEPPSGDSGPDQFHRSIVGLEDLADIAAAAGTGERMKLSGGISADTQLVRLPGGRMVVHKSALDWGDPVEVAASVRMQADGEQLTSLLAVAIEAPVARVYRNEPDAVWMEYIDGGSFDGVSELLDGPDGFKIGLLDVLSLNLDRNSGNLLARKRRLVGIDHGFNWGLAPDDQTGPSESYLPFRAGRPSRHFLQEADGERTAWRNNALHPADIAILRDRIEALRPDFALLNREDWLDYTLRVLAKLAPYATGTERIYG